MIELTVLLAPDGPAAGVLDALADLSGAGLVDRFLWVTDRNPAAADHDAVVVEAGRRHATTIERTIADAGRLDRIRLCVLVPLLEGATTVGSAAEEQLREVLQYRAGGPARLTALRCLLVPPSGGGPADVAARDGWHNLLVAPEDSLGPDKGRELLHGTTPVALGRYAAPVVAGVAGLWTGMDSALLDSMQPQQGVRAVRSYYRRIDAEEIEHRLRARVLSIEHELPQPMGTVAIEPPGPACRQLAAALWRQHAGVLGGEWRSSAAGRRTALGWRTAMAWLWGFLGASLRGRAQRWYESKVLGYASPAAAHVHATLVGQNEGAYRVVVDGMTPSGAATWPDLTAATAYLDQLNFDPGMPMPPQPRVDLSPLWNDYVAGAMTLCDGGQHAAALPPYDVGGRVGVLRHVDACVPAPERDFTALPPHLKALPGVEPVRAGDVIGVETVYRSLRDHAADPAYAREAEQATRALRAWASGHEQTYAVQVGSMLAATIAERRDRVGRCLALLGRAAAVGEQPAEIERSGRRSLASRLLVAFTVVAALALATTVGLAIGHVLSVAAASVIGGATVVCWLLASYLAFLLCQRDLFRDLESRRAVLADVDSMRYNLRAAIRDLHRLVDAYEGYLFVTRVLGRFLRQPYGPKAPPGTDGLTIARGLPLTTRIARAEADDNSIDYATGLLRQDLFGTGWLRRPWRATLDDARRRVGPRQHELPREAAAIFQLAGRPLAGSALQDWGERIVRDGVATSSGDLVWRELRDPLTDAQSGRVDLGRQLLATVRSVQDGSGRPESVDSFVAGLDQRQPGRGERFLGEHFAEGGITRGGHLPELSDPHGWRDGLSGALVLVQYGRTIDADLLRGVRSSGDGGLPPAGSPDVRANASTNGAPPRTGPPVDRLGRDNDDLVF